MPDGTVLPVIYVSVRSLVEFVLRSGDIDNRYPPGGEELMQMGSKLHRKLQSSAGSGYEAEVRLRYVWHDELYDLVLDGRADGIITEKNDVQYVLSLPEDGVASVDPDQKTVTIDEIKGTYRDLRKMTKPVESHLAQAKCYAFMYAELNDLPFIRVRMTYCHLETEEIRYFHEEYTRREIKTWFASVMDEYRRWAVFSIQWKLDRDSSIEKLKFPFDYRPGQKELVGCVWQTIKKRKNLFLEAPTGTGKTISVLYPSIRALALKETSRIFYLTAKTVTAGVAEDTIDILRNEGLRLKNVTLSAKEKVCFHDPSACNPDKCEYAAGHFDRVNDAMYDLLTSRDNLTRDAIVEAARAHKVCPFELSLDLSLFSDVIIGDYNYVFDPHVRLKRFFSEGVRTDSVFLVDEAHNLVDRGRSMYSAALSESFFRGFAAALKGGVPSISRSIDSCLFGLRALFDGSDDEDLVIPDSLDSFIAPLNLLAVRIGEYLEKTRPGKKQRKNSAKAITDNSEKKGELRKRILEHYFVISHFLMINDLADDKYVIYCEREKTDVKDKYDRIVNLFCADPSTNLRNCLNLAKSSVLFSATLIPIQYYKSLLGGDPGDFEVYAKSVFKREQCGYYIASDVTSRYSARTQRQYDAMASYVSSVVTARKGNYIVFCPS
ncbi:MAG: ATP-dependent DNA helicase, partial [Lachnospiraceae bacterium]|nr:ATP-dependent DNA helicase [Lachnospiraceae bacterium]